MVYLKVAYNGREFHGSQYQPNVRTVEGDILQTLEKEGIKAINYGFLSRTDRGVSALSNILRIETEEDLNIKKLTHLLEDIWIYGKSNKDIKFPLTKTYRYYLFDNEYDESLISKGLSLFHGNHDFFSFSKYNGIDQTRRTIETSYRKEGPVYILEFKGNGFLWQMIRRIVGAVVAFAKGNLSENEIVSALNGEITINANPFPADYLLLYKIETSSEMYYDDYVIRALKRRFNELLTDFSARSFLEKDSLEFMRETEKLINRD
ncbi:MAG: tRNA pseudouridine synthase A [Candidatus Methanofastidiosum methylothiophilum]|uniref:tRNA pseudouridine synthase n=1 Tax=Candidatus Methanofastidiosum methylothiophilum TaxID=1705564 RepID=A0A150IJJ0_9EURY|nr:MAG: tRNA pseudouridine synthase A [Candidatus Methanofastidiosum methylthiophilus]KYC47167.1 MAG: tRNA pseudouridine synthase A [Candidatus Methanofastidiosum methylthiophilus]KYC49963.1 MAG: tRNA pseudouridine synthase A [Candidatus Methanofastidiosum methylthiophilus]